MAMMIMLLLLWLVSLAESALGGSSLGGRIQGNSGRRYNYKHGVLPCLPPATATAKPG
jgi:hypothetical protein